MGAFADIVAVMEGMNLFQLFFPWLLILAVTYGLLQKYEIFGDESVAGVVSLSVAFLAIGGFSAFVPDGMFVQFAAAIGFGIFGLLGLIILLTLAGIDVTEMAEDGLGLPGVGALVITIVAFIGVIGSQLDIEGILGGVGGSGGVFDELVMPVLVLIFLFLVIGAIAQEE